MAHPSSDCLGDGTIALGEREGLSFQWPGFSENHMGQRLEYFGDLQHAFPLPVLQVRTDTLKGK